MKKNIIRISLIAGLLIIIIAVIMKKNVSNNRVIIDRPVLKTETQKVPDVQDKQPVKVKTGVKKRTGFKSNQEIKEEYGKIETVHLWNGKVYTGAVINSDEVYTIVTVDGIVNIPMKDVKLREIIR